MNSIKITFCGDFVSFSPAEVSIDERIKRIIVESDISVVNLEAPLSGAGDIAINKSGPVLSQPQESAEVVKALGFNVVGLANNHIMDYGEVAAKRTKSAFDVMASIGLGTSDDVYQVAFLSCKGRTIGFLTGCQREFGTLDGEGKRYGYAWINDPRIDQAVIKARKQCDYLFVLPHAGVENVEIPLPEWRRRYRSLIDLGADAIVASHPHIVQGYEEYKGKRVYYSLGNFYFDRPNMPDCWHHGLMVTVNISVNGLTYENNFVRLEGTLLQFDQSITSELDRLNSLLEESQYEAEVEKLVKMLLPEYDHDYSIANSSPLGISGVKNRLLWLCRAIKGYRDDIRLVNLLRCESHRWLYIRCLNYRSKNNY